MTRLAAHRDEQLAEMITIYEQSTEKEKGEPGLLERLALSVGLHPAEYFGRVAAIAYRHNYDVSALTAAINSPLVIQAAAEFAQTKEGFKDRELILKASKVLEQQSLVTVNQTQQTLNVSGLPKMESLTGKVSDMIRGAETPRGLLVEGEILELEAETPPMGFKVARIEDE